MNVPPKPGSEESSGVQDEQGRLRVPPLEPPFHIVLLEPEIPPNTGNVARICAATTSPLHLVGPLGFRIDEHSVRRAGLDYWPLVDLRRHLDWPHFLHAFRKERGEEARVWLFTARTGRSEAASGRRTSHATCPARPATSSRGRRAATGRS